MPTFRRITKRDDPAKLAADAARYEALLTDALAIARRRAKNKPPLVQEIVATGKAEGLGNPESKYAVVSYRAETFKRTWLSLIGWQYLEGSSPKEWADSFICTVEANIHMTETDSWPRSDPRRSRSKRKTERRGD